MLARTPQRFFMFLARFSLLAALAFGTATLGANGTVDTAHAQAPKLKVGITVAATINGPESLGVQVSEALGASLLERFDIEVVAGANAQATLPAIARSEQCLGDSACLVEAGKALGVDELLMLIVVDVGDQVKVEATWVEVSTGKTALRTAIDAHQAAELMAKDFEAQAKLILPDAPEKQVAVDPVEVPDEKGNEGDGNKALNGMEKPIVTKTRGRQWTPLSKGLLLGGGAAVGISLLYGGYHLIECGGTECSEDKSRPGADQAFDIVGGLGVVSVSVASFLYFTSEEEAEQLPVSLDLRSDRVGVTFGGRF